MAASPNTAAKSTPIAQLPFSAPSPQPPAAQPQQPPPGYVNEQHRQLIAQAQQAAQAYTLPQPSSQDIAQDDDATINDVLGVLQGQQQQHHQQQAQPPGLAGGPSLPPGYYDQLYGQAPPMYSAPTAAQAQPPQPRGLIASIIPFTIDDIRSVIVAVVLFVVASMVPVAGVMSRYVSLDSIPYADTLVRASIFGVALLVAKKALAA